LGPSRVAPPPRAADNTLSAPPILNPTSPPQHPPPPKNHSLAHVDQLLARLLGGTVKLYTTRCVTRELLAMGPQTAAAAAAARALPLHKCEHQGPQQPQAVVVPAAECLRTAVGECNADHWWVATQDRALRAALDKVRPAAALPSASASAAGAVPCLFASVNGLHLADPPRAAKRRVDKEQHDARRGLTEAEREALESRTEEQLAEAERLERQQRRQQQRGSGGSIKFRRKRAGGPNPLSVRKKDKRGGGGEAGEAGAGVAKKQQRRKRPAAGKAAAEGG
jgi:U3 small nucleolar RNA-associated protein 23